MYCTRFMTLKSMDKKGCHQMFEWLCLHGLNQINGDRTLSAFYHIMTGKRSIQTIQDTRLYQLEKYYHVLPALDRHKYDELILSFESKNWIKKIADQKVIVTEKGRAFLTNNPVSAVNHLLEGLEYYLVAPIFIARFELAVQTYTHLSMNQHAFDPIQQATDVQQFIKQHYHLHRSNLNDWLTQLYQRIHKYLLPFQACYAEIFVERLTAYQSSGQSIQQLTAKHQLSNEDVELILLGLYHQLIKQIEQSSDDLLGSFVLLNHQEDGLKLTRTAAITSRYLARGFDIEAIATHRNLKQSTIEDHLVEICYHRSQFDIRPYVTEAAEELILAAIDERHTYKVATIKQALNDTVSYLAIRLVLAKIYHRKKH